MEQIEGVKRDVSRSVKVSKLFSNCEKRPAITMIRRRLVKTHRHDLCRKCWKSGNDSRRYEIQEALAENIRETQERDSLKRIAAGV